MLKRGSVMFVALLLSGSLINNCAAQGKKLRTIVVDAGHGGTDAGAIGQYEGSLRSKEKDVTLAISMKLVDELRRQLPDVKVVPTRTTDVFDDVREKARIANEAKGDLFLCIHADSGGLQTGRRQTGTRMVTRYKVTYTGKGRHKKKHSTPYNVEEPVYEYFKLPLKARGTTVYIFSAGETNTVLSQLVKDQGFTDSDDPTGTDSTANDIEPDPYVRRQKAQIYMKLYLEKSDRLASFVEDEIAATGRPALGVNQRQKGIWVLEACHMPSILVETGYINNEEDERYINSDAGQQEIAECITKAVIRYKQQLESNSKSSSK
jgi:N-acetylmuramoyl-L-alanine amidase